MIMLSILLVVYRLLSYNLVVCCLFSIKNSKNNNATNMIMLSELLLSHDSIRVRLTINLVNLLEY